MDASVNKVIIMGRLGADPELRYTSSGKAVASFSVATNRSWEGEGGGREERTDWHKVVAWGKVAENVKEYLVKGQKVYVEGRLENSSWEDKEGVKRYKTEVVAREVLFLEKPRGVEEPDRPSGRRNRSDPRDMAGHADLVGDDEDLGTSDIPF
jgi:single-strand DNA-binding protein